MSKKLCVVGLGYIGLPTATVFAENGWEVTGVDVNLEIVNQLNKGIVYSKEVGLNERVEKVVGDKRLKASSKAEEADVFIIAVPTPHNPDYSAYLQHVEDGVKSIIPVLRLGNTIIVESTVPPRTTRDVVAPIIDAAGFKAGEDIYLSYCPERVLPGRILAELYENNRIVGGINSRSATMAADVYRSFVKGKVMETISENAEMSKLMENTYRDVNIALANELTKISEQLNVDALEVISLANEHPRVNLHQPGPGVGGHCIAVDPYFIVEKSPDARLISEARAVNDSMPQFLVNQVKKTLPEKSRVAVFGLAYKGNVDDIRESPAITIVNLLLSEGFDVKAYDPHVSDSQIKFKLSAYKEALQDAEMLLVLTDHDVFKKIDWEEAAKLMKQPNILDAKNCITVDNEQINYYNYSNLYELKRNNLLYKGSN